MGKQGQDHATESTGLISSSSGATSPGSTEDKCLEKHADDVNHEKSTTTNSVPVRATDPGPADVDSRSNYLPILHRIPWSAIIAMVVIVLCIVGSTSTLKKVKGIETRAYPWRRITPNVILSISAIIANASLRYIAQEGFVLAWWRTALDEVTINDLHWVWKFQSLKGVLSGIFRGRFNPVGMATLATIIVAAHGALFQRSVKASTSADKFLPYEGRDVTLRIAQSFPDAWTGVLFEQSNTTGGKIEIMTSQFRDVVAEMKKNAPIKAPDGGNGIHGCSSREGECRLFVRGIGLDVKGKIGTYDLPDPDPAPPGLPAMFKNGESNATDTELGFYIQVTGPSANDPHLMTIDILYKNSSECGDRQGVRKTLTFTPAIVSYYIGIYQRGDPRQSDKKDVIIDLLTSYTDKHLYKEVAIGDPSAFDGHSPDPVYSYLNGTLGSDWQPPKLLTDFATNPRTYGGIVPAIGSLYNSYAIYRRNTANSHQFSGTSAQHNFDSADLQMTSPEGEVVENLCGGNWNDPTEEIVISINNLMLRSALHQAYSLNPDDHTLDYTTVAVVIDYSPVWEVDWLFAFLAAALPATGVLLVLPTFWGFWRLERKVTGSPIEVAEAFDIKRTIFRGGNEDGKEVGQQPIRYVETEAGWMMEKVVRISSVEAEKVV